MGSINILIRHSGKWNEENCYVEYSIDGILVKEHSSYTELINLISEHLNIDLNTKVIKIEYKVEGNDMPMEIRNDMGVRVYIQLKKCNPAFGLYPLCVNSFDLDIVYPETGETFIERDVMQLEYNRGLSNTIDTLDLVECLGSKAFDVCNGISGLIITNKNHKEVKDGQIYLNKATLKAVMRKYSIERRFKFRAERSSSTGYKLVCRFGGCSWLMRASSLHESKMFRIREFSEEHTCPLKDGVCSQIHATSEFIGAIIEPKLRNHKRKYTPNDIIFDMKLDFGVDVNYMMAWRAKEKALCSIMDLPAASYQKLPGYLYTLDKTYPGSHIRMKKSDANEFMPIVVVDASHLKSAYTGAFVSASTLDGAGNILPLAYGVIDSENDAAWT